MPWKERTSKRSDGQRFWLDTSMPSSSSTTVALVFGSAWPSFRTSTSAFISSTPAV
ncbi:Uncharacterised protein [Bordetella pertussis]|nr:Uncharacterised protein [Bordetella pertussis]CPH63115.1 Uncharacterised protein [Bordetella pertussis]CPM32422.1 Uncharacterised protein [Bordetella pertussis]CPN10448.1 Uncharacterised protein [Bordetella pertussis]CPO07445.1 Uncharacterised protein [Bordetella pertussis]